MKLHALSPHVSWMICEPMSFFCSAGWTINCNAGWRRAKSKKRVAAVVHKSRAVHKTYRRVLVQCYRPAVAQTRQELNTLSRAAETKQHTKQCDLPLNSCWNIVNTPLSYIRSYHVVFMICMFLLLFWQLCCSIVCSSWDKCSASKCEVCCR